MENNGTVVTRENNMVNLIGSSKKTWATSEHDIKFTIKRHRSRHLCSHQMIVHDDEPKTKGCSKEHSES